MEYSEKFLIFAEYLGLNEVDWNEIEQIDDNEFKYNSDYYKILSSSELDKEIQDYVDSEIKYNMQLIVDEDYIQDNVEENYADFIGTGTVEVIDDEYYIFLL